MFYHGSIRLYLRWSRFGLRLHTTVQVTNTIVHGMYYHHLLTSKSLEGFLSLNTHDLVCRYNSDTSRLSTSMPYRIYRPDFKGLKKLFVVSDKNSLKCLLWKKLTHDVLSIAYPSAQTIADYRNDPVRQMFMPDSLDVHCIRCCITSYL